MAESDYDENKVIEALKAQNNGQLPDWFFDPIERAERLRGGDISAETIEAHLNQFGQAYADRLGGEKQAERIGYQRNIAGQGLPPSKKSNKKG